MGYDGQEMVSITLGGNTIRYYRSLGYYIPKVKSINPRFVGKLVEPIGGKAKIKVDDLMDNSVVIIKGWCDVCKKDRVTKLKGLRASGLCIKCSIQDSRKDSIKMFGGDKYTYKQRGTYYTAKANMSKRKVKGGNFTLSPSEYLDMCIDSACYYCGNRDIQKNLIRDTFNNNPNGVDRIDSDKGYTPENCVPCCQKCNTGKSTMPQSDYIAHCKKVVAHMEGKPTHQTG